MHTRPEDAMRLSPKVKSELALTVKHQPGNDAALGRLRQEYKASRCAEYLTKVVDNLASRTAKATAGPSEVNARRASRASVTGNDASGPNTADVEYRGHGRTQWDAMAEAISSGRFRAVKLALLIFVRYGLCTGAGLALAYKLIEMVGQHR